MPSTNFDAALQYLDKGFSIIPCRPDKKPYISWAEYQTRKPTVEEISRWFEKYQDAMIAIITGKISGVCVIDCDTPEGKEEVDKLILDSPVFPVAETPRGGFHYYFMTSVESIGNNAGAIPGVDFRGEGGYIIAPPSMNGNGKAYHWLDGKSIFDVPLPPAPCAYISFINSFAFKEYKGGVVTDNNGQQTTTSDNKYFIKGTRDNDIFHAVNGLIKGGCEIPFVSYIAEILARNSNPPFPENEIKAKIDSALKRAESRERNLTQEIREMIVTTSGNISTTFVYNRQQVTTREEKKKVAVILQRLEKEGLIERTGDKAGCYRIVDNVCEEIDFLSASDEAFNIKWPFEIEKLVKIQSKNIIVVAGEPNSGKTALTLNIAAINQDMHEVYYFSSEMGSMELKDRLSKFDRPLNSWKIKFLERSGNFADVIRPDAINIIDFLEINDEFYKVGAYIKQIFDKLDKGIAIIALQKNKGVDVGLGGGRSLEKARLYLSMEPGKIKIIKAKNWADSYENPNGLECSFKLIKGCHFIPDKWHRAIK